MNLNIEEALNLLSEHDLIVEQNISDKNQNLSNVSYNSLEDQTNGAFFCKGTTFKKEYLEGAISNGAKLYVAEQKYSDKIDYIIVKDAQKSLALLSALFYGNPERSLSITAFTGTKGKTTTSYFIYNILNHTYPNKVALFSTVDRIVGPKPGDKFKSDLTTPESLELFRDMRTAVDKGMTHLVMEVSSQAYKRNRVYGLQFDIGGFLNISPDHIGENEHPTFEDYLNCKKQLLINSKVNIINSETNELETVKEAALQTSSDDNVYLYGRNADESDVIFESKEATLSDSIFDVKSVTEKASKLDLNGEYKLSLVGDFNESNATAAMIAAKMEGASNEDIFKGLVETQIPGRMEHISTKDHGDVFVDYAHNYASMKALMDFLKTEYPESKITVVVGSPGNKGISRRSGFAKVLTELADQAILTTDDPGFEDPADICREIDSQIDHSQVSVKTILDRKTAIKEAISNNKPSDIVILAAKGSDPYQKINGVDTPYEGDTQIAKDFVAELENRGI
ncbi:UDP-N-acetylmuramoyl-L-alanyl-D-glutamate--2,6-diaminopimelate ligase [Companilactobacillus metriopterae]|uniref:UDP-N-acetylmuramoyl-L-alanyl-D-glutamate--2, 6-diaminopimelate ligase n=1 Tax=Companilactobacillus metriopterae TaxID=1909267 RepID=UPI00100A3DDE|nr:UDP-N-acetylmuramoyl-L-alanyl-D-glutamate--2,6-diaminopimelate ligase [Companilactobacillus metriopterae]